MTEEGSRWADLHATLEGHHQSLARRLEAIEAKVDKPAQWVVSSHFTTLILVAWTIGCIALGAHFF